MMWALYKVELFKARKRLAVWGIFTCFAFLVIFPIGAEYFMSGQISGSFYTLPDRWPSILVANAGMVSTFTAVLLVLLVASEFDWRTSRQNIIDGLSKEQWFIAKVLLIPTVTLFFYLFQVISSATYAWLGTSSEIQNALVWSSAHYAAFFGVILGVMCHASFALLFSLIARSVGTALVITILYPIFEGLVAGGLRGYDLARVADFLPIQVSSALQQSAQYWPDLPRLRSSPVSNWDTSTLFIVGIAWLAILLSASYLKYRKQDL